MAANVESPSADLVARPRSTRTPSCFTVTGERKERANREDEVEEHGKAVRVSRLGRGKAYWGKKRKEEEDEITRLMQLA